MGHLQRASLLLLLTCCISAAQGVPKIRVRGQSITEDPRAPYAVYAATSLRRDGDVIHLRGDVELRTNGILVQADEVDYYWHTGEIKARGEVIIRPSPTPQDKIVGQFGIK